MKFNNLDTIDRIFIGNKEVSNLRVGNSSIFTPIVRDGLVLYLDAGIEKSYPGTGTTWFDLSGNGYNATISGTNRYTISDGGKFDFRNISTASDYISLPHSAAQTTTGSYTLVLWMQPLSSGTRYFHSVHDGSNDNHQIMQITSTIQSWNGGSSVSFTNNEFIQLTLVREGSDSGKLYKNDLTHVSSTITDISNVTNNGWILNQEQDSVGGGFDSNQNAYAAFSVVQLYNRALSASEIQQNYNATRGRFGL